VLVRSWNLFHGNTVPPQRRAFLDEMLRLATADEPDVLCVQEVPGAALGQFTAGDIAARPRLLSATLGEHLTDFHHGLLRSLLTGQGNAMLVAPRFRVLARTRLTLNPRRFRQQQERSLRLPPLTRLAWARERRIVQGLRLEAGDGRRIFVANLHCTSYARDPRPAEAELLRAAWFATSTAAAGDVVVLAGDFNVTAASPAVQALCGPEWGFSPPGPGIDHVLVRGADTSPVRVWPQEQRLYDGLLLSDHAPVEVDIR